MSTTLAKPNTSSNQTADKSTAKTVEALAKTNWHADLSLGFTNVNGKTTLSHRKHSGPLRVQRPLYPEAGDTANTCHVLLLHPPAGIASGDKLTIDVDLDKNTHALLTTPGAGKWYGSCSSKRLDDIAPAYQDITLNLGEQAFLEWLPQEVIVFNEAKVQAKTNITLHPTASTLAWEVTVFGRKAFMERFLLGNYHNEVTITEVSGADDEAQTNNLLIHDLLNIPADDRWFHSPLGMNRQHVFANFWAVPPMEKRATLATTVDELREFIEENQIPTFVTQIQNMLVIRHLGSDVQTCFKALAKVRAFLRQAWWGYDEHYPRIWNT